MSGTARKVLLLFAHPSLDRSEVNIELLKASRGVDGITIVDLYAEYPDYRIDIEQEQQRLLEHDVIIFMFPMYWYSTPAMLKEWQDLVLEYGFAYGHEGTALHGKVFLCAFTAGGAENAYREEGYNHFTVRQLLAPLEQTAELTGMHYLAPFALFGARTAMEEGRIKDHVADWCKTLEALKEGTLDIQRARQMEKLNDDLGTVLAGASA